ncbi:hypothetical protein DM02DRAFT_625498 [Periconia macrospinosa]|uniref:Probable double zinc ribbon domain-containing protein n=1 Tax=Periconia macrospinosa TaxID=97972 RepID=A0A2V1E2B1_9PLEO|nr:hypothetical protein DM02DRAFT_625498 [Periconia macrospinosa]
MYSESANSNPSSFSHKAQWACPSCDHHQLTWTRRGNHPFGRVICEKCNLVPAVEPDGDDNDLMQMVGLESLPGREYKLSLPPDAPTPPKTKFVWICCRCGISHRDAPKEAKSSQSSSPRSPSGAKTWLGRADSFRKSLNGKGKEHKLPVADPLSTERKVYRLKFNHKCTVECKHRACETCFRGVWRVGTEWLVRVYNDEDIARVKLKHGIPRSDSPMGRYP